MKLIIALPTAGAPAAPFLESLKALRAPAAASVIDRLVVTGNFVPGQRELLVRQALERKADFLLMLDDDMVLPPDALERLYATLQSDARNALAGALYYSRDGRRPMVVSQWQPNDTTEAIVPAFTSHAAVPVGGIGFGCVLLRMAAVATLSRPFFAAQIVVEAAHSHVRICNEDYLFCKRLLDGGFRVMLDARVRSGHYDREQAVILPHAWEPDEVTAVPRMHVRRPDGVEELVPFVPGLAHAVEEHQQTVLDYLFI